MKTIIRLTDEQWDLLEERATVVHTNNEKWFNLPQWFAEDEKGLTVEVPADELPDYVKTLITQPAERTFTLTAEEMLNIFRSGAGYALNQFNEPNAKEYFKDKFSIEI